jgi:hypothetical protein
MSSTAKKLFERAAAFRGLLESAGDTLDGLVLIPGALALHRRAIADFVQAKWMRTNRGEKNILKAKENINYFNFLKPASLRLLGVQSQGVVKRV